MNLEEMNRIKEERGYSFTTLSVYTGIPTVTLQKIFSGATENPRKFTMDLIEEVLLGPEEKYPGKAYMLQHKKRVLAPEERMDYKADEGNSNNPTKATVRETFSYGAEPGWFNKKQGEYTIDDYYALPDDQRYELIDGVLYMMGAPTFVHQDIMAYVFVNFYDYIRSKKKPCKVVMSPIDVHICKDNRTMVQPDVIVICERDKITNRRIEGSPDFCLEVLSPSTRKKDMTIKLSKYLESGVREYWIIDPKKEILMVYHLEDDEMIPEIHKLDEEVPVYISDGELVIDLKPIAETIEEFGKR